MPGLIYWVGEDAGGSLLVVNHDEILRWRPTEESYEGGLLGRHSSVISDTEIAMGSVLASVSWDGSVRLWNLEKDGAESIGVASDLGKLEVLALSPDGGTLAVGGLEGEVYLYDLTMPEHAGTVLTGLTYEITALAFSPDGLLLAGVAGGGPILVWSLAEQEQVLALPRTGGGTRDGLEFSADGNLLLSYGWAQPAIVWDLANPGEGRQFPGRRIRPIRSGPEILVAKLIPGAGGESLVTGHIGGEIIFWNLSPECPDKDVGEDSDCDPIIWTMHDETVHVMAVSDDGGKMLSGSRDGRVVYWNLATSKPTLLGTHPMGLLDVVFLKNGQEAVTTGPDGTAIVWDLPPAAGCVVLDNDRLRARVLPDCN